MGSDLLAELDRRAKGGLPFDFKSRQELRRLDSRDSLSEFLQSRGFGDVPTSDGVAELADYVYAVWATRSWRAMRRGAVVRIAIGVLILIAGLYWSSSTEIAAVTFGGLLVLLGMLRFAFMAWMPRRFGRCSVPL